MYEDSADTLWVAAETGLWRWKPGPPKLYPMPEVYRMIEGDNGTLLMYTSRGIRQLVHGKAESYPMPGAGRFLAESQLGEEDEYAPILRDRDGGIWIGTLDHGLLHVSHEKTDPFAHSEGLSSDRIRGLLEDREGNIWVATQDGLDRFRDFAIPTISARQGLSSYASAVLAAKDGGVWIGTDDGLNKWNRGQMSIYRKLSNRMAMRTAQPGLVREIAGSGLPDGALESLLQDDQGRLWISTVRGVVGHIQNDRFVQINTEPGGGNSMALDSAGNLWANRSHGLLHLLGESLVEQIPWAQLGPDGLAASLVPDSLQHGLWLGFFKGGVAYFKDGQVRASYHAAEGLGEGIVEGLQLDPDGTLWAATQGGLSRIKNGRVATLTSRNGLPCDAVHWMMEDDDHSVWLYTTCGLVRVARTELDAWEAGSKRTIEPTIFDVSDGARGRALSTLYSPQVTKTADGKLWFLPGDGVSVIDPRHLPFNKLPPPVHIEQVTADGRIYDATHGLRLPALVRDVRIDFTALSLVAPEKVHFRYKLEGQDRDWKEMVNDRRAQYSNLAPRNYRFRVMASNNSGVWNEAGASFDFSIDPAYYQTRWFQASCAAAFLALLWALYRLRLHQIARGFNVRLEERVDERTRIARELHDTLLQSFHGSLVQMQAARHLFSRRPEQAGQTLDEAITMAEGAIAESRDAIQDLRSQPSAQGAAGIVCLRRRPPGRAPLAALSSTLRRRLRWQDGWRGGDHHGPGTPAALEHDGQAATCSRDRGGWHFGSSGRSSTWDLREPSVHVAAASA